MGVRYKEKENKPESLIRNSITISKVLYAVLHYSKFALCLSLSWSLNFIFGRYMSKWCQVVCNLRLSFFPSTLRFWCFEIRPRLRAIIHLFSFFDRISHPLTILNTPIHDCDAALRLFKPLLSSFKNVHNFLHEILHFFD